ncbi:MAG: hypothetical protein J6Y32_00015 [Bacteroidales bacterium]|nr:hypothetical protein [Bacteroidales bacterium]
MKRVFLSIALVLPLLLACNKDNGGTDLGAGSSIQKGENFDVAKTYSYVAPENGNQQGGQSQGQNEEQNFITRTCVSTTSDGSFVAWDEDVATKAVGDVIKKYNFRYGTYVVKVNETEEKTVKTLELTVQGEEKPFGALVIESPKEESAQAPSTVSFVPANEQGELPADEQGNIDTTGGVESEIESSAEDSDNPNEAQTNGTWVVQETIAIVRGANFSKPGLDVHAFASWAYETLGIINANDVKEVEGYKVSNLMITDSMLTLCFDNGKFFSSNVDLKNVQSFKIEDFFEKNSKVGEYINGTGKIEFSGDLCVLTIDGAIKGTKATIALTLKRK